MSMMDGKYNPLAIVKIVGEPFLSRALAYREGVEKAHAEWRKFGLSISADRFMIGAGFIWLDPKKVPKEGWTRVGNPPKHFWRPRKKSPLAQEVAALPKEPSAYDVFDGFVHYAFTGGEEGGKNSFTEGVGMFVRGPTIGWAGDIFIAHIPHVGRASRAYAVTAPSGIIIPDVFTKWEIPKGLEEITEAERDLIFAQARVDAERKAKKTESLI